jgi:hypothetical protein
MIQQVDPRHDAAAEAEEHEAGSEAADIASDSGIDAQATLILLPPLAPPPLAPPPSAGIEPERWAPEPQTSLASRAAAWLPSRPLALTLLACLLLLVIAGALDGMRQYALIRGQTVDALQHIRDAQALLGAAQFGATPPGRPLGATTLAALDADLAAADQEFAQLSAELDTPSGVVLLGSYIPRLSGRIASAAALVDAAGEACQAGRSLVAGALVVLELRSDGFLDQHGHLTRLGAASPQAATLVQRLQVSMQLAASQLDAAVARARSADFSVLPPTIASPDQIAALHALLAKWPTMRVRLASPESWQQLALAALGAAPLDSVL